jgi:hypothetical protein
MRTDGHAGSASASKRKRRSFSDAFVTLVTLVLIGRFCHSKDLAKIATGFELVNCRVGISLQQFKVFVTLVLLPFDPRLVPS